MINFSHVDKRLGNQPLLSNITLFLPKASYTTVCGPDCSGKTTLLRLILAYEKPDSGSLIVDDLDIGTLPRDRIPFLRRQIGYLETVPAVLEDLSVAENLRIPLQIAGLDRSEISRRVDASLTECGLEALRGIRAKRLNYSQRRIIACARATIHRPRIVLADEAAQDIDDRASGIVYSLLEKANNHGATVLAIGGVDSNGVMTAGSKIVYIEEGSIRTDESTHCGTDL